MLLVDDVEGVQKDWQEILQIGDKFVDELYNNLFKLDPDLKCLFKRSMKMQGRKVMSMFDTAISRLNQPLTLVAPLTSAGERHEQYGVQHQHYETLGQAFITTLASCLDDWSEKKAEAWSEAFAIMVAIMADSQTGSSTGKNPSVIHVSK